MTGPGVPSSGNEPHCERQEVSKATMSSQRTPNLPESHLVCPDTPTNKNHSKGIESHKGRVYSPLLLDNTSVHADQTRNRLQSDKSGRSKLPCLITLDEPRRCLTSVEFLSLDQAHVHMPIHAKGMALGRGKEATHDACAWMTRMGCIAWSGGGINNRRETSSGHWSRACSSRQTSTRSPAKLRRPRSDKSS